MKVTARNIIPGTIEAIEIGQVEAEIIVKIAPGVEMTSIITKKSCENFKLEKGKKVYVVVKASEVMIGMDH